MRKSDREAGCVVRHEENPILKPSDIPYRCDRVYNPAACRAGDESVLILRTEAFSPLEQSLGLARSSDGVHFTVEPEPVLTPFPQDLGKMSDPRISFIDGWYYLTYCSDPSGRDLREEGIYLCIARTRNFREWEWVYSSEPDNRNAVIFPEKIGGLYARLDRPFRRGYRREHGYDIWISYSPDMEFWGRHRLVLSHYDVPWGSHKIGPGAPPIRTEEGWLVIFHGAEVVGPDSGWLDWPHSKDIYAKAYYAGVMLLDLKDPSKVVGRRLEPLLAPREPCELDPVYRPNVIFPCGALVEPDGEVKIYYGASDTTVCLATARLDDLVALCLE